MRHLSRSASTAILCLTVAILSAGSVTAGDAPAPQGRMIIVTPEICRSLTQYVPPPDVTYTPGVDVNGNPVAPADLPGDTTWKPPQNFEFSVILNPFNPSGTARSAAAKRFSNTQMPVAKIHIDLATGEVTLDGKPIGESDAAAIAAACREHGLQ
jgi:hypothetical protein